MNPNESNAGSTIPTLIRNAVIGLLAIFVILGLSGCEDSGNVPGKKCFDYKKANGDWANSCD